MKNSKILKIKKGFVSFCVEDFEILDIAKYVCYCCQILCFGYQDHCAFLP
jgi:hypothetical protein